MSFADVESMVKAFKQSLNACRGHCTKYSDTLHIDPDVGTIELTADAEIGHVFKESSIVKLNCSAGNWYVDGTLIETDTLRDVLLSYFARFQIATLQVANALEAKCTHHGLSISYETPDDPNSNTVVIKVYRGALQHFRVDVHKNASIDAAEVHTTIHDTVSTVRRSTNLYELLTMVDKLIEPIGCHFRSQQETAALWHAVGKLSSMLDKMMQ